MSTLERKLKSFVASRPLIWSAVKKAQEWNYSAQYYWYYRFFSNAKVSTTEINLEFCSNCNLRCRFCALDHLKPKAYMSSEVLDKVFDNLFYDPRFKSVNQINLYNGGETLMHPKRLDLFERIQYHKERFKIKERRFPKIVLLTNGMLLREQLAKDLLSLKVLDEVGFSLDGGAPKEFEHLRVNAKWDKFATNLTNFVQIKEQIAPSLQTFGICIVPEPKALNNSWMHPEFAKITDILDSVEYRRLHDWGGEVEIGNSQEVNKKGCSLLMKQLVVLPDGEVSVCCNDLNRKGTVGNLKDSSLNAIYNSEERRKYVDYLQKGLKSDLDLCKSCVSF